ncbi:hypothetical protein NC651_029339 [Populus alba x Populus x berolinensis]|nr:hypothetical protein NC651_029339 [Populus alba x Populus x berolinensis]
MVASPVKFFSTNLVLICHCKSDTCFTHALLPFCIQPNCFNCGACDRAILQSFYFYCKWCNFAMDIECALLPTVKAQSGEQFCHFNHGHPLTLTEIKDEDEIRMCSATNRKSSAPSYGCIAICPCIAEIKCVISVVCSN